MPTDTLATLRRGTSAADVEALCASTGFSRFPVVGEDGELLGYLHIKDVIEELVGEIRDAAHLEEHV
jgi:CBS domain containing-hemolysin-like protein